MQAKKDESKYNGYMSKCCVYIKSHHTQVNIFILNTSERQIVIVRRYSWVMGYSWYYIIQYVLKYVLNHHTL